MKAHGLVVLGRSEQAASHTSVSRLEARLNKVDESPFRLLASNVDGPCQQHLEQLFESGGLRQSST